MFSLSENTHWGRRRPLGVPEIEYFPEYPVYFREFPGTFAATGLTTAMPEGPRTPDGPSDGRALRRSRFVQTRNTHLNISTVDEWSRGCAGGARLPDPSVRFVSQPWLSHMPHILSPPPTEMKPEPSQPVRLRPDILATSCASPSIPPACQC